MKSHITKALIVAGLGVFLASGVTSAEAKSHKDYRFQIGEEYKASDHGLKNQDHKKFEKKNKKKKRKDTYWGQFDNRSKAERSHAHMRSDNGSD